MESSTNTISGGQFHKLPTRVAYSLLRAMVALEDERQGRPVIINTDGYELYVLGFSYNEKRRRNSFIVYNPQTGRKGNRVIEDITRAMRDRSKLKVLDLMRDLNKDDTWAVQTASKMPSRCE